MAAVGIALARISAWRSLLVHTGARATRSTVESTQSNSSVADPMLSRTLGRYRIVRKIAEGGMGAVYEAFDDELQRRAAVKVLLGELLNNADAASRFFNEARAVSLVTHPSLVTILSSGTSSGGEAYIVMEYLDGDTLRQRLERRYLGGSAIGIMTQLAAGLAVTHASRIIHRDLKPENIMLVADAEVPSGERVKIVDFGIAKLLPSSAMEAEKRSFKTRTGTLIGTPTYMSPEQCRASTAEPPDEKTDVYALGIIFYELLYGEPPFTSESAGELFALQMFAPPPRIEERVPALHPAVGELVHRLLAKKAASRPNMAELHDALQALPASGLQDGPLSTRPCVRAMTSATAGACSGPDPTNSGIIRHQLHGTTGTTGHEGHGESVIPVTKVRRSLLPLFMSGGFLVVGMVALLATLHVRHKGSPVVAPTAALQPAIATPTPTPAPDAGTPPGPPSSASAGLTSAGVENPARSGPRSPEVYTDDRKLKRKGPRGGRDGKKQNFRIDVWK